MSDFPTIVYRCPGPHWGPPGTTYGSVGVNTADELAARLAEGYHRSIPEAAEAFLAAKAPKVATIKESLTTAEESSVVADNAPPTRDEMLEQAARIGLKTDKRWSDATLLANIEAHMKGSK